MRIGLIAPAGGGKTSYLAALQAVLADDREGSGGAALQVALADGRLADALDQRLAALAVPASDSVRRKGAAPEPTEYTFAVTQEHGGASWAVSIDAFPDHAFHGGEDADADHRYAAQAAQCDAFILLLGADQLMGQGGAALDSFMPGRITDFVAGAFVAARTRVFSRLGVPVVFCVNKCDKLQRYRDDPVPDVQFRVRELFPSFFRPEHAHPVLVVPASLGRGIDRGGAFEPINVELPFEFCLGLAAASAAAHYDEAEADSLAARDEARAKAELAKAKGAVDTVVEWFRSGAAVGEFPSEYWRRAGGEHQAQADQAGRDARRFREIGRAVTGAIHRKLAQPVAGGVFYNGVRHRFRMSGEGERALPLEALGNPFILSGRR